MTGEYSEQELDVLIEDEEEVDLQHDDDCNIYDLHFYGGIRTCLSCGASNADPATHDKASLYKDIRQRTELRLLSVKKGEFGDEVHCLLIHCEVEKPPDYEAISYTWADESGNDTESRTIYISSSPFAVTVNCEAALKRVRMPGRARTIWIDAVCINQENKDEQNHQVQLMHKIYSRAKKVLIYLGESMDEDLNGLEYISWVRLNQIDRLSHDACWEMKRAIRSLLRRRYFSRVWVLQEVYLARDKVILCGEFEVSWERLQGIIGFLRLTEPLPKVLTLGTRMVQDTSQLLQFFDLARDSQAKDPRDKVFAVFGMIDCAENLGYVADYCECVEETYSRIAVLLAETSGLIPILARAVCRRNIQTLPSWVTDWSHAYSDDLPTLPDNDRKDFFPTIFLDKRQHEIGFVGARLCCLERGLCQLLPVAAGRGTSGEVPEGMLGEMLVEMLKEMLKETLREMLGEMPKETREETLEKTLKEILEEVLEEMRKERLEDMRNERLEKMLEKSLKEILKKMLEEMPEKLENVLNGLYKGRVPGGWGQQGRRRMQESVLDTVLNGRLKVKAPVDVPLRWQVLKEMLGMPTKVPKGWRKEKVLENSTPIENARQVLKRAVWKRLRAVLSEELYTNPRTVFRTELKGTLGRVPERVRYGGEIRGIKGSAKEPPKKALERVVRIILERRTLLEKQLEVETLKPEWLWLKRG
ncbi:hypothetical protein DL769_000492 [Monosporascus sp. CRB-8-3]|nr:hypothetical protein DL769_000492 [Monosporascus sp. CRB-8-3]